MPFFKRRKSQTKLAKAERVEEVAAAKTDSSSDAQLPEKSTTPLKGTLNGKGVAEEVFKEQGWTATTAEPGGLYRPPTPPSSPPQYNAITSSMSRSKSQPQALPYHRPWNRHLSPSNSSQQQSASHDESALPLKSSIAAGAIPMSQSWSHASSFARKRELNNDFRISPSMSAPPTPAQRKQVIDAARRISLKKAKAPSDFNMLVMGAKMTGKTSWIRTLLSTCDLSHCNEETKISIAQFGISASNTHLTRRTDPITPLATKSIDYLGGIEMQSNSFLPLASLDQHTPDYGTSMRAHSHVSTRASLFSTSTSAVGAKRLQLSICDTPGIDFDIEDEFETQRKVNDIAKYVEGKLSRTLVEEGKVQRKNQSDNYVHLIVYFIDPRHLVEKSEARRRQVRQSRSSNGVRSRSQSETQAHRPVLSNKTSSSNVNEDTNDVFEEDSVIEGLSPLEVNIIAKMCKYANVLPVIAKADTLTVSRLNEVRYAVRQSLKAAKIDLGTFDFASAKSRKKKQTAMTPRNEAVETMVETREGQLDQTVNGLGDVKVIRLRPRRSFSASTSGHASSTIGHYEESEVGHSDSMHDSYLLQSTDPLFPAAGENEEDEEATEKMHQELLKIIPLSIFVPEPVQLQHRKKKSTNINRPSIATEDQNEGVHVPPVPRLPRLPTDGALSVDLVNEGTPRDSNSIEIGTALSPLPTDHPHSYPLPTALQSSNRYERNYRWGTANVLDPEQCDFGLLRSTILGTHVETLKESTSMRYEQFRSRRLELSQKLRQSTAAPS